jgi:hypothetical protein
MEIRRGMSKKKSKLTVDADQLVQINPVFHTEKEHKKWFEPNIMGKQRGKPRYDLKERKKEKK